MSVPHTCQHLHVNFITSKIVTFPHPFLCRTSTSPIWGGKPHPHLEISVPLHHQHSPSSSTVEPDNFSRFLPDLISVVQCSPFTYSFSSKCARPPKLTVTLPLLIQPPEVINLQVYLLLNGFRGIFSVCMPQRQCAS